MSKLKISDSLSLPLNAVTQKLAFLGRTGSGKSYGAGKMAEEMLDAGAQVVILDVVGIWYGLRLLSDGKSPGFKIPVLGGLHGDIPLEPTAGALIADLIVDRGISVIIDVSQFEFDTDKARFGRDFANRFFFQKKAAPSAVHVIIEECQELIPQNPQKGEEQMLHAFQRMWKLGRNFGIGGSLISQRPQEVSKKVLNQSECLFAFQMTAPHERKAVEDWMQEKGLDLDIAADLPKLQVGNCHVWSLSWLRFSDKIQFARKQTFDASSTPEVGKTARGRKLAPIDLVALSEKMKATIERAKADDPAELKKQIRQLQADLKKSERTQPVMHPVKLKFIEKPVISEADFKRIEKAIGFVKRLADDAQMSLIECHQSAGKVEKQFSRLKCLKATPTVQPPRPAVQPIKAAASPIRQAPHPARTETVTNAENGDKPLGKGAREVLKAIAQNPDGATEAQIAILTGYKRSSRGLFRQQLSSKGFIESGGREWIATQSGADYLGDDLKPLPTGQELREHWMNTLSGGELALFKGYVEQYPNDVPNDYFIEGGIYQRSSVGLFRQKLAARNLIVTSPGRAKANPILFD
jgi:hypothetical protein